MEKQFEEHIRVKIAVSLRDLLNKKKEMDGDNGNDVDNAGSYNKIANTAEIRKGTVSDAFNAKVTPSSSTVIAIVQAMGFKLTEFAKIYDSLEGKDLKL